MNSHSKPVDRSSLLERFLRYVQMDTTAVESASTYPSSPGQLELGRLLVSELKGLGLSAVEQDEHGLVMATIPSTTPRTVPVVALNAHLDTSPETRGDGVRPQVIRDYRGGDLVLPGDPRQVIRVQDNPELQQLHGCTLITSDGTTLLGADDKSGIAVIMETAAYLQRHPQLLHGPVRVLFTCDEEIGRGVEHVDPRKLQADVCYTLDGGGADTIDVETFSADLAVITVHGINVHPSIAKGRMVNALRAAGTLLDRLPRTTLAPEVSEGREGFLHPYTVQGGVAEVVIKVLLRDFDTFALTRQAERLRALAAEIMEQTPGISIDLQIRPQYRNLADGLRAEPRAVTFAQQAHQRLGRTARLTIIRGGTDGALLTAQGLPTPNLSSGQHTPHSPLEWACLDEMAGAVEVLVELVQVWAAVGAT